MLLNVENGPVAANSSSGISNPNKQAVAINDSQFRFIKLKTRLKPLENSQFLGSAGFWSALVLPLALIPLFIFFGKTRRAGQGCKREQDS